MKLTKGKISKLYNKKKQSLKKVNKRKGSNKSKNKTFRRKRHINLARRSLKRFHYRKQSGGEEIAKVDVNKNINEGLFVPEKIVTETGDTVVPEMVVPETVAPEMVVPETVVPEMVVPETVVPEMVVPETVLPETVETVVPESPNVTETVETIVPESPNVTETVETVVPESPIVTEPSTMDSPLAGTQIVSIENIDPSDKVEIIKNKLNDALNSVAEYISDKVSENISKNVEDAKIIKKTPEVNIQNGFDSVNKAVETISSTGGSKKRKTRKFRIQKQKRSKTKKHIGGGEWLNNKDESLVENDSCPICLENFLDTPNQAIYKSECGHIFHNDCMLRVCDSDVKNPLCPLCRKPLENDCNDVYAFKEKALGRIDAADGEPYFADAEIQTIYENQT